MTSQKNCIIDDAFPFLQCCNKTENFMRMNNTIGPTMCIPVSELTTGVTIVILYFFMDAYEARWTEITHNLAGEL